MKKMLGGIKKHGLAGAVNKQLGQWAEPVIEQAQKIDGGAEKHGGLGQAALVYMGVSSSSSGEVEAVRVEEVRRQAAEAEARRALEAVAKREAEEAEVRRTLEEVAKREVEKPTLKKFMLDFLSKTEKLDDDIAFGAIEKIKKLPGDVGNDQLAQMLFSFNDELINKEVISWFVPVVGEAEDM